MDLVRSFPGTPATDVVPAKLKHDSLGLLVQIVKGIRCQQMTLMTS